MHVQEIRNIIKSNFDEGWLRGNNLHKTNCLYDKEYYVPQSVDQLKQDIDFAQGCLEDLLGVDKGRINNLYTQKNIFDCDNFAASMKTMIAINHYQRYLDGKHESEGEYFCMMAIGKVKSMFGGSFVHAFNMFIACEHVYFYDMTNYEFWTIGKKQIDVLQLG